jgi:hypothetical protein
LSSRTVLGGGQPGQVVVGVHQTQNVKVGLDRFEQHQRVVETEVGHAGQRRVDARRTLGMAAPVVSVGSDRAGHVKHGPL